MTHQSIVYSRQDIELPLTTTKEKVTVPGFVAEGTGLGYYIDEAPGDSSSSMFEIATGRAYLDYYVLIHLASGSQFPWHVYTEQHMRTWIERVASLIDWTLTASQLTLLPEWKELPSAIQRILDEVTKPTKRTKKARASK